MIDGVQFHLERHCVDFAELQAEKNVEMRLLKRGRGKIERPGDRSGVQSLFTRFDQQPENPQSGFPGECSSLSTAGLISVILYFHYYGIIKIFWRISPPCQKYMLREIIVL